jgi:hypothetical protein
VARTEITGTRFCEGDGEVSVVQVKVRLKLASRREHPVVVYTGSPIIGHVRLSRTVEDMRAGRYVSDGALEVMHAAGFKPKIAEKLLVTLRPGDTHVLDVAMTAPVMVDVRQAMEPPLPYVPQPGTYLLQLTVGTWPLDDRAARQWSRRLADRGELFTGALETEPIPMTLEAKAPWEKCTSR